MTICPECEGTMDGICNDCRDGHEDQELADLQAIVAKLPKCWRFNEAGELVQDKPMVPTMVVWRGRHGFPPREEEVAAIHDSAARLSPSGLWISGDDLYDSLEAANAAGGK